MNRMMRVRFFMTAMYIWAAVIYYLTQVAGAILSIIMRMVPNSWTPSVIPFKSKPPIHIFQAFAEAGGVSDVTNKLRLYAHARWDTMEDRPNIDLNRLSETLHWAVMWVCYMTSDSSDPRQQGESPDRIRVVAVDFVNRVMQRFDSDGHTTEPVVAGRFMF